MSAQDLTAEDLIEKFELQVDDLTELSTDEELDLLNDKYQDVCSERPWEFLKKNATNLTNGAIALDTATGLYYITMPTDFSLFVENDTYTDNAIPIENNAAPKGIFLGITSNFCQIVNYSDRLRYKGWTNVAWLDLVAKKIFFAGTPADISSYTFDYIYTPDPLEIDDTPAFPNRFRKMLAFAMAVDNEILQRSPAANSQAIQNQAKYDKTMSLMDWWNDNLNNT